MKEIFVSLAIVAMVVVLTGVGNYFKCHNLWDDTKVALAVEWAPFQGCKIKTEKDGWIPAENFRVL